MDGVAPFALADQPAERFVVVREKSRAGAIAFWLVLVALIVLSIAYWLHLQNDCTRINFMEGEVAEKWEFWKYKCP